MKIIILGVLVIIAIILIWKIAKLLARLIILLSLLFAVSLFLFDEEKSTFYHPVIGSDIYRQDQKNVICQAESISFKKENNRVEQLIHIRCPTELFDLDSKDFLRGKKWYYERGGEVRANDLIRFPFYNPLRFFFYLKQL